MGDSADLVRSFYTAIEAGTRGDALARFVADDVRTIERPNALVPTGRVSDRAAMLAASEAGAELLASQRYDVISIVDLDGLVIARLTWTGVVAHDAGPFRAGQSLTAHIAQFVRVRDGRIAEIETYDCHEPFAAA